jgi:intracellular multiplication protein IcmD
MSKLFNQPLKAAAKIAIILGSVLFAGFALATPSAVSVSALADNVGKSVGHLAVVLTDVSIIAGIGFVMASFFKFHQHKLNPTQVPLSQGITLLLIGAALLLFPTMLPTATHAVFGSASFGKISGSGIKGLIGAS